MRPIEVRIRRAAALIAAGLILQVLTLIRAHPLSFMAFLLISCLLVAAGILMYLNALVSDESHTGG